MSNSKLIALVFNEAEQQAMISSPGAPAVKPLDSDPEIALEVLKTIDRKAKEANVQLDDLVVVFKDDHGKVKIKQSRDLTTGKGAKRGSFWGLLVGLIFGGPFVGVLWGLGIGALVGRAVDHGIDDKFIKDVGNAMQRRSSAVMIMLDEADYDRSIAYLRTFDTEIYEADVSEEAQSAMSKVAENKQVADAVVAEFEE